MSSSKLDLFVIRPSGIFECRRWTKEELPSGIKALRPLGLKEDDVVVRAELPHVPGLTNLLAKRRDVYESREVAEKEVARRMREKQ